MFNSFKKLQAFVSLILFCLVYVLPAAAPAQVRPVNDYGALGLGRLLKKLNTTASVMMIGAHPDDEDSGLLAYLARHDNADTAYLSLTRGDGGQNIIGPELFESLGVIRSEELLQARRLDGAQQFFTRAFDYGFSKTLAEARQKWDERVILCDTVRAIRVFRPLVVISRFSGTPADGHGQHQYAGYISPFAVKAAADPQQCKGSGEPWQVLKFYVEQGFGGNSPTPTVRLNTGEYDPMLGRTYFEVAMEGRSQHKSQGEGRLEFHGDIFSGLNLKESQVGQKDASESSPFYGINTSLSGIAKLTNDADGPVAAKLGELQSRIESITAKYRPFSPADILGDLVSAMTTARQIEAATTNEQTKRMLSRIQANLSEAITQSAGIQIDALADRETIVPGDAFSATINVFFPTANAAKVADASLRTPTGWQVTKAETQRDNSQGFNRREVANRSDAFKVTVPTNAKPTQPYFLENPRDGDFYRWPGDDNQNLPFQPPLVVADVKVTIDGIELTLSQPVQFRYADQARGEIRRDLNVVPAVSVDLDQKLLVIPESDKPQTRRITMSITNNSAKPASGTVSLNFNTPETLKYTASSGTFNLKAKGEKTSIPFDVTIPGHIKTGGYEIYGRAMIGESLADETMNTIAYPHIQTHRFYTRAETDVTVLNLKVAPVKVGYIMGSGDEVPSAIRQMGLDVTMLEEKDLASGDLSRFDSIVVGIRASETRPDFASNNQRLLDYVKNGGNLIVQYQRPSFAQQNLLPFPATIGPRVVDENAKVTILQPNHPIFNFPNKITDEDFKGWVQERNLYNFDTFDKNYVPLLESHDEGEKENSGGMVYVQIGKGRYIYSSYSWFRQLPAGNPGAYRMFANMLSLPKASK